MDGTNEIASLADGGKHIGGEAVTFRPPFWQRCLLALDFRYSAYAERPDGSYRMHAIVTHWDWCDRLRILVSGRTHTEMLMLPDIDPKIDPTFSTSTVVLMPGSRLGMP